MRIVINNKLCSYLITVLKTDGKSMDNSRRRRRTSPSAGRLRTEEEYVDNEDTDHLNENEVFLLMIMLIVILAIFGGFFAVMMRLI